MKELRKKIHFNSIDSTSAYILRRRFELRNFTCVSADFQTDGRGRTGRKWESEKGQNLTFSVYIKDGFAVENFHKLSLFSAVAVVNALEKSGVKNLSVKWPNDVYSDGKKICGILLNGITEDNKLTSLVIGIGINVNQQNFPEDLLQKATSVYNQTGVKTSVNKLKNSVYKELITLIKRLKTDGDFYFNKAVELDYLKGKTVFAEIDGEVKNVTLLGINPDCSIKVEVEGEIFNLTTGEITFNK